MRRVIVWIILLAVILGPAVAVALWWRDFYAGQARTYTVDSGDILSGVTVSGTIRSVQQESVATEVLAVVKSIDVQEGQEVPEGKVLVRLDDGVIVAEAAKAVASVEVAAQMLAELEAGPRKEEIEKARKQVSRAEAEQAYAEKYHESIVSAAKRGVATQSELDLAINRLNSARAELGYAQAELALLQAGTRKEQVARAGAELALAKAELQRLKALQERYTLRAAHAGVVTVKKVHVGEVVSPAEVLLQLDNVKDLEIRAQVQESQLSGVTVGGQARVLADAYPDRPLEAVVERILPRVDPEQGTITVLLALAGPPPVALMDGMAADIALIGKEVKGVVRMPAEAVEGQGRKAFVWVRAGRSFVRRSVVAGISDGHWIEIKSGLQPGEVVRLP